MSDPSQYQPVDVPPPQTPPAPPQYSQAPPAQSGLSDSAASGLAYFTFIPGLVFLLTAPYNQNREIRFHSWQSIILSVTAFVFNFGVSIVASIVLPWFLRGLVSFALYAGWFVLWLMCVVQAFNGKRFTIPVIGDFAAKQAN